MISYARARLFLRHRLTCWKSAEKRSRSRWAYRSKSVKSSELSFATVNE